MKTHATAKTDPKSAAQPVQESQQEHGASLLPPQLQFLGSPPPPPVQRQVIQKEDGKEGKVSGDVNINPPRESFEFNYEFKKVGNLAGSFRVTASPKGSKLIEGEIGHKTKQEGPTDFQPGNVKSKAGILESKMSIKKSHGKKAGREMATALAKLDLFEASPFEWLKISMDVKAFEAKLKANAEKGGEFEAALAKISGNIKAVPPKSVLLGWGIPQEIVDKYSLSISGKIEYKVPFEDLARLQKMHKASREVVEQTKEIAKKTKARDMLETRKRDINKQIKQLEAQKKALNHGGAKGMSRADRLKKNQQLKDQLTKLRQERKTIKKKSGALKTAISKHKSNIKKAKGVMESTAKKLKSKSGRLIGKTIQKVGGKIAGKIIAKLIPGLNILSTIVDVIEISVILYKIFDGQLEFGLGGGEGEGGKKGEDGAEGSGGEGENKEDSGKEGKTEGGSGGEGGENEEGEGGQKTDTSTEGGIPDFDKIDPDDESLYEPVTDPFEQVGKPPTLKPQTRKLIEAMKGSGEKKEEATALTNEALSQLNDAIPDNLSDEELQELINRMKSSGNPAKSNPEALIGRVLATIDEIRTGAPADDVIEEVKEIDYQKAGQANKNWQGNLGWTVAELSGQSWAVDSKEFVDYVAAFQSENGINGGGIAGPRTTIAILTKLGKTDSPAFAKAKEALAQKSSDERTGGGGTGDGEANESLPHGKDKTQGGGGGAGTDPASEDKKIDPSLEDETKADAPHKKPEDGAGGTEENGSDEESAGEEMEELINDRPPVFNQAVMESCISYDQKAATLSLNDSKIKEIQGLGETLSFNMSVKIKSFSMSLDTIASGDDYSIYKIKGSMQFEVTGTPMNAGDQYPYEAGQTYTESLEKVFDPKKNVYLEQMNGHAQALANLIDAKGGKAVLKEGVAGTERDLVDMKAKVMRITHQHASEQDGKTFYVVGFEIIPTELREFRGKISDGKMVEAELNKPYQLEISLTKGE